MDRITLKNYRCFREEQSARLAPLTLLVGDNSTGKSSFLAMIRALWDLAADLRMPDFKEEPYDLGSFDDVVHYRSPARGRPEDFKAGFHATITSKDTRHLASNTYRFDATFGKHWTSPVPTRIRRSYGAGNAWVEENLGENKVYSATASTQRGTWKTSPNTGSLAGLDPTPLNLIYQGALRVLLEAMIANGSGDRIERIDGSTSIQSSDIDLIQELVYAFKTSSGPRPFASAPVRSEPRRTYDPSRTTPDAEGGHIPMYLADISFRDREEWAFLKDRLDDFGRTAGLFNEINVRRLGKTDSSPFQVQVRKARRPGDRLKGPWRNLIDVGYGVSQVLPVITELLRPDATSMFLLQQPEVHLHPSAQAALGGQFCQAAATGKQLVVETHSDHLMDRVRMDVRDGVSDLKPKDVSILFFERDELDVRIHSLGIDEQGNITGAPQSYRKFFMEEVRRSLWA